MRRVVMSSLVLILSACQLPVAEPPTVEAEEVATRRVSPTARPTATRSQAPAEAATPTPAPTAIPSPEGPTLLMKGQIRIDASYILSTGAGTLISANGASVIQAAAGSLISNHGGGLIGKVKLISNNGGTLAAFRLLEAPALGTMLPVKGMMVVPLSLLTGEPLGPAVLTDEAGGYQVTVPEGQQGNVLIHAAVPAKDEQDPILHDRRLQYTAIAQPEAAEVPVIDEDEALLTRYVQSIFVSRLAELLAQPEAEFEHYIEALTGQTYLAHLGSFKPVVVASLKELHAAGVKAGVPDMPSAERRAIAERMSNALIATLDLGKIKLNPEYYDLAGNGYEGWEETRAGLEPGQTMVEAMRRVFGFLRDRVSATMGANGGAFPPTPYMAAINARRAAAGEAPYMIKRPSDFGDMLVREYFSTNALKYPSAEEVPIRLYESIGATTMPGTGVITEGLVELAQYGTLVELQKVLILDPEAKARVLAVLDRLDTN